MKRVCLRAALPASLFVALLAAGSVFAQTATGATGRLDDQQPKPVEPQHSGPMKVTPVRNALIITPEVRFGRVNHRPATLVGLTGGVLLNNHLLLGVGGYWQASSMRAREMGYGGAVVGWYLKGDGPIDLRLAALVGGGWSRAADGGDPMPMGMDGRMPQMYPQRGDSWGHGWTTGNGFFVAEPTANLCIRINRSMWISAGVGYRFISGARGLDNDMQGITGSAAITFGHR